MANSPGTDRNILTKKAYATDEALLVRQRTHDLYSVPRVNFGEWVLDRIEWRGDERVLDVGSGPGSYFDLLRERIPRGELIAGDLSMGMARKAKEHPNGGLTFNLDAQALPFRDATFDVVMANHMLYHVPNLDQALTELHRVLKPEGCLIAATNSLFNQPEFEQLIRRSYGLLGALNEVDQVRGDPPFSLENGPMKLSHHFYAIVRYDMPGAFVFPSLQPVLDYLNSMRALREPQLPRRISWEDFMTVMGDQVQRLINHFGELVINKLSGALVATDRGGFASDYVALLHQKEPDQH